MKKCRLSILLLFLAILGACGNHSNQDIETMSEYCTNDSFLCCKIPSFLQLTKTDGQSMQFEGNKKFAKVMIVSSYDRAVKDDFVQQLVGNNRSKLTVIEENDTITAFEIQRGITIIPAQVVSIYQRNGYAVLLATMGVDIDLHKTIGTTIKCNATHTDIDLAHYNGDYINLDYPSNWTINEHPGTQTADLFIGNSDHSFGIWLFRFEKDDNISFDEAMTSLADSWREVANVGISNESINGIAWCKQDIQMTSQGQEGRQVSYYALKGNMIYNIKFGNKAHEVEKNQTIINDIMRSVELK